MARAASNLGEDIDDLDRDDRDEIDNLLDNSQDGKYVSPKSRYDIDSPKKGVELFKGYQEDNIDEKLADTSSPKRSMSLKMSLNSLSSRLLASPLKFNIKIDTTSRRDSVPSKIDHKLESNNS